MVLSLPVAESCHLLSIEIMAYAEDFQFSQEGDLMMITGLWGDQSSCAENPQEQEPVLISSTTKDLFGDGGQ